MIAVSDLMYTELITFLKGSVVSKSGNYCTDLCKYPRSLRCPYLLN